MTCVRSSWSSRSSALLLLWLCCTFSAGAQAVTPGELVAELTTILTLLQTAQSEYATVSSELQTLRIELATLQSEEIPRLERQLSDLRISFGDYKRTVSREVDRLRMQLYITAGVAVVATVTALLALLR